MLLKILSNFSEDELHTFLPKESLNFALNANSEVQELNKYKLATVIVSTNKADFLLDKKLRCDPFILCI
jgi:DNA repair protein RadD